MPKYLFEIDAEAKDGHSEQPGSPQIASVAREQLVIATSADRDLPWQVLQVREIPLDEPGPRAGYRPVTVAVTVHVPAATGDHTVTEALNKVLDEPPCHWAGWFVGAVRVISRGYPDPHAGPPATPASAT
jgi:hypothetical protein